MGLRRLLLAALVLTIPVCAFAQEAVLTGTITDSTAAVRPGVTVTVLHEASGNRFVAVTDERGVYRIPARVGAYQIAAELQDFATAQRNNIELGGRGGLRLQSGSQREGHHLQHESDV